MYRFLATPRWIATTLATLLAVVVCVLMGTWQLSRFDTHVASHRKSERQAESTAAHAAPLTTLLGPKRAALRSQDVGKTVTTSGTYDPEHQLLVPNRKIDGHTGYYVLTPLKIPGDPRALPVVRGWHPGAPPAHTPAPPQGRTAIHGVLQAPEGDDAASSTDTPPTGQLSVIRASSLVNILPYPVHDGWITLTNPTPGLRAVPPVTTGDTGLDAKAFQNLGYTAEWFVFAGFALFMWFRLIRREAETQRDIALGLVPTDPAEDGEPEDGEPAAEPAAHRR